MKKSLSILVLLSLTLCAVLSGCSKSEPTTTPTTGTNPPAATPAKP